MKTSAENPANVATQLANSQGVENLDFDLSTGTSPVTTDASASVVDLHSKDAYPPPTDRGSSFPCPVADDTEFEDGVLRRIDPNRIRVMQMPNRDSSAFESDDFEDLHRNVLAAGGNTVPISVAQLEVPTVDHDFELIAGERRMRACIQANLRVLAIVKQAAKVSDRQRILETIRENLARQNLSPFEFGRQLKHAIDAGLSPSARALARDIGRHHSDVSAAIKLASLPEDVVTAFASTADLQYRFEGPLSQALEKNQDAVLKAARDIRAMKDRPAGKDVLQLLSAAATPPAAAEQQRVGPSDTPTKGAICCDGNQVGSLQFDRRGHAKIMLDVALTDKQQASLHKQIESFVKRCMAGADSAVNRAGDIRTASAAKASEESHAEPVATQ